VNPAAKLAAMGMFGLLTVWAAHPAGAEQQRPEYIARVALRLDFGTDPSQIYINWGPLSDRVRGPLAAPEFTEGDSHCAYAIAGFAVDGAGNIYISSFQHERVSDPEGGDYVDDSPLIKKFVPACGSRLAGALAMYTEPTDHIISFAVSPEGALFTYDGDRGVVAYDCDGRRLWSRSVRELGEFAQASKLGRAYVDPTPALCRLRAVEGPYLICSLTTARRAREATGVHPFLGVVLDRDGNFVAVLPTDQVAPDGRIYGGLPEYDDQGRVVRFPVRFYTPDGEVIEEIELALEAEGAELFDNIPWGVQECFIDAMGCIVVPYHARVVSDRFAYGSVLEAHSQENFLRYDLEGRFLEKWSFPGSPFEDLLESTIIGHDGNFYHLAIDDTGVNVIQYRPDFTYAALPEKPLYVSHLAAFRRHDTLYVRLREVAARTGARVVWQPQNHSAIVSRDERRFELRPGSEVASGLEGEIHSLGAPVLLRAERLWVPAARLADLLDLPLYTDKEDHVAYLAVRWNR